MPPIVQRMTLLKIAAKMMQMIPRVIKGFLPCSGYSSAATLFATVAARDNAVAFGPLPGQSERRADAGFGSAMRSG